MTDPALGFIGLGQIGGPMAHHWVDWPGGLTVCDVVEEATRPYTEAGAAVAASPAAVAKRAQIISLMVRDDDQVNVVVDGILETAAEGTVVIIHSTVEADTPAAVEARCSPHGVHVIDAPVSGGFMGAADGTLAMMVGGSIEAVAIARPALERFGPIVAHLGPIGAGTRAKIARNLITFAAYAAVGEAARLAQAAGVDLAQLGDVVRHSDRVTGGPGSIMIRDTVDPLPSDDGLRSIFEHTRSLGEKDLKHAISLGEAVGVETPIAASALARLAFALGVPDEGDTP